MVFWIQFRTCDMYGFFLWVEGDVACAIMFFSHLYIYFSGKCKDDMAEKKRTFEDVECIGLEFPFPPDGQSSP